MRSDFMPRGKGELLAWLNNFNTVANAQHRILGLDEEDIEALKDAQNNFSAALDSMETAKKMVKSAAQAEESATQNINDIVRDVVRRVQARKGVMPALKAQLGINPRTAARNHAPPVTPEKLTVSGLSNGINQLNWNRTGNKFNTIFVIEALIGNADKFVEVGCTSATRFQHSGQTPGVKAVYRVVANRAGRSSPPSLAIALYVPNAAAPEIQQKAA